MTIGNPPFPIHTHIHLLKHQQYHFTETECYFEGGPNKNNFYSPILALIKDAFPTASVAKSRNVDVS